VIAHPEYGGLPRNASESQALRDTACTLISTSLSLGTGISRPSTEERRAVHIRVQTTAFMSCLLGRDVLTLFRQVKHGAQNALFGVAQTAMSNDRDWRQIGGSRAATVSSDRHAVRLAFLRGAILIGVLGSGGPGGRARSRSGLRLW